jgi:hypothetical protein
LQTALVLFQLVNEKQEVFQALGQYGTTKGSEMRREFRCSIGWDYVFALAYTGQLLALIMFLYFMLR